MRKQVVVGRRRKIADGHPVIFKGSDGRSYYETETVRESQLSGDYAISAQLVESHRVDGKPRQKVIKYLGSVNESRLHYVGHRIGFWRTAQAAFKALALPPDQQHTIELALHARVPFPTQEEVQKERDHFAELEAAIKSRM